MPNRWYTEYNTGELRYYRLIPKVDLHRHLEGSLRVDTLFEVARQHQIPVPETRFQTLVQMQKDDPLTVDSFLSKFQTLRQFYRSPEIIARVAREAVMDAASDNIHYLELRFTPIALARLQGYTLAEVMDWVIESASTAAHQFGLMLRFIVSVNRHEAVSLAEQVADLALQRRDAGVVGLDLAGNEAQFSALPFAPVFREAQKAGLHITCHAGEWGGAQNVRQAIEDLGAERIGHGVRVLEDPRVVDLARERGTVFEVCVTSNFQSGVVPALQVHPLPGLLGAGLKVTINTDDPGISGISLSDEYRLALNELAIPPATVVECTLQAARSSFLPKDRALELEDSLWPSLKAFFNLEQKPSVR